jgi:hypothetical protein
MSYSSFKTITQLRSLEYDASDETMHTRMRVPKMVKNGHNSVLHISAGAQEDSYS